MKHDEQFLGQIEGVLIGAMDDREDVLKHGKVITKACREYGEVVSAPLEARILALEEALAVAHKRPYNSKVFFATKYGVPVHDYEPHPLLADREVVL